MLEEAMIFYNRKLIPVLKFLSFKCDFISFYFNLQLINMIIQFDKRSSSAEYCGSSMIDVALNVLSSNIYIRRFTTYNIC